jgi:N-dimethylarginine dimethylaminohydrolase
MATVNSHNDWDPLEEIFVGVADHARIPTVDTSTHSFCFANYTYDEIKDIHGAFSQVVIDEANEDLDRLSDELRKLGVTVRRPEAIDHSKSFKSPDWETTGWYTYCPRDLLLPLDNLIIDCPGAMRARQYETLAYRDFLYEVVDEGGEWLAAPRPRLLNESYQLDDLSEPTLTNKEIVFDAPNVVRLGKDLIYQVSNSGNLWGYKWLKSVLGPRGYRIHLAEKFYSYSHFDSTVIPLRPGLVLFNGDRCTPDWYPPIFKGWDKIFISGDQIVDIGTNLEGSVSPCSKYIGLNMLSVNEELVIIDENQEQVRKELTKWGIESVGLPMRQARTLSGGFHCVTLDTKRKGKCEDYFS